MHSKIKESLDRYAELGVETGGFLAAVLSNDLVEAVCRADDDNMGSLKEIVLYVYNELPSTCWGSREKVKAWLKERSESTEVTR